MFKVRWERARNLLLPVPPGADSEEGTGENEKDEQDDDADSDLEVVLEIIMKILLSNIF